MGHAKKKNSIESPKTKLNYITVNHDQSIAVENTSPNQIHKFPYPTYFTLKNILQQMEGAYPRKTGQHTDKVYKNLNELRDLPQEMPKILSEVIPPSIADNELIAVTTPFNFLPILVSTNFARTFVDSATGRLKCDSNLKGDFLDGVKTKIAAQYILRYLYDIKSPFHRPDIDLKTVDTSSGIVRHFGLNIDDRYASVHSTGKLQSLSDIQIKKILLNINNPSYLLDVFSPIIFYFQGFFTIRAFELTTRQTLTDLHRFIISDSKGIIDSERFTSLCNTLRSFLKNPSLKFSLTVTFQDQYITLKEDNTSSIDSIFRQSNRIANDHYQGSVFQLVDQRKLPLSILDYKTFNLANPLDRSSLRYKEKTSLIMPLKDGHKSIAYFQIHNIDPAAVHTLNTAYLIDLKPALSLGVIRSHQNTKSILEATIKENCTAIHPAVEWKFQESALSHKFENVSTMGEIRFDNVYPFFAISDIRDSSEHRNQAVKRDIAKQLEDLKSILSSALATAGYPILDKLLHTLSNAEKDLKQTMTAGAETSILNLIRNKVHPILHLVATISAEHDQTIAKYWRRLDRKHECYSKERKQFESSVNRINTAISDILIEQQRQAQESVPHYFQIHATDGVDHALYSGQSILEKGTFEEYHRDNLRLWQLMSVCESAVKVRSMRGKLPPSLRGRTPYHRTR